ncbi:MAG: hypothetical protein IPK79_03420 [Vampirovibrionales bacterium]|nr:hypothetical protein [Vampirovibrionales bacterium]
MSAASLTPFEKLTQQLEQLPLWVKQVIYAVLRQELERALSSATLTAYSPADTLQIWRPELTSQSQQPSGQAPAALVKVLHFARYKKTVMDMAIMNGWSLEQTAILLLDALDRNLLLPPKSGVIMATLTYLGGKIRLGEYLVKIGRLTIEQLDQALRTQMYIDESLGERTGIANVLINLGYINRQDSEGILLLKEESKKVIRAETLLNMGGQDANEGASVEMDRLRTQLNQASQRIQQLELRCQELQQAQGRR